MKNVSSKMKNEGERKKESKKKKINVKCQKKKIKWEIHSEIFLQLAAIFLEPPFSYTIRNSI